MNHSRIPIGVISTKNRLPLPTNSPAAPPARNPSGISPTKVSLISIVLVGSLEYCLNQGYDFTQGFIFYQAAGKSQRVWEKKQITTKAVQQQLSKRKRATRFSTSTNRKNTALKQIQPVTWLLLQQHLSHSTSPPFAIQGAIIVGDISISKTIHEETVEDLHTSSTFKACDERWTTTKVKTAL